MRLKKNSGTDVFKRCRRTRAFLDLPGPAGRCSPGLDQAVCPEKLDPGSLFLSIRREAAGAGHVDFSPYKAILDNLTGNGVQRVLTACPMREETHVRSSVRNLLDAMGVSFIEMKHQEKKTLCCGEGGSVGFVRPDLAKKWSLLRQKESGNRTIMTYCAGCAGFLGRTAPTLHLADLLFSPDRAFSGRIKVAGAPFTYLNRLRLKQRFKKAFGPYTGRSPI